MVNHDGLAKSDEVALYLESEPKRSACLCVFCVYAYVDVACVYLKFIKSDSLYSALLGGTIHISLGTGIFMFYIQ